MPITNTKMPTMPTLLMNQLFMKFKGNLLLKHLTDFNLLSETSYVYICPVFVFLINAEFRFGG